MTTRRPVTRLRPLVWLLFLGFLSSLAGCNSLKLFSVLSEPKEKPAKEQKPAPALALPSRKTFRHSQFVFHVDFDLRQDLPLFRELGELRDQVYKELQLPGTSTLVQVYLFEDRDRYERFMRAKYPDLPRRRAFFVAQPRSVGGAEDLLVYTYWGDRIRQDLRHELTHALLHSVLKDVPLWLDEGLAEYFEVPPEWLGVNYQHLDQFRAADFEPDLTRLERLGQVAQMTPGEYREAWTWVHFMLKGDPRARTVLLSHLQQLRSTANVGPLQQSLADAVPDLDEALVRHVSHLESGRRPASVSQR